MNAMKYIEIFSKTALSKSSLEGTDYSLNPYIGCQHACTYCYAPYVLRRDPDEWTKTILVKKNLPLLLEKELKRKRGSILISSVTDPYQPAENVYHITRQALEILKNHNNRVSILTKSALILRDFELICKIHDIEVGVSFSTLNEFLKQRVEPQSSTVAQRLQILQKFAGYVPTYVMLAPMIYNIENETESMLQTFSAMKVSYIILDRFRMKEGMRTFNTDFIGSVQYSNIRAQFIKNAESYHLKIL